MGGLVFANTLTESGKPITTPRLPVELYKALCAKYQCILETLFQRVVIPRDAPAKKDFGDIDYLVEGLRPPNNTNDIWEVVRRALKADAHLLRGGSASYAVPHPETVGAHVQVDLELSVGDGTPESAELFEWTRFMKGDSDLQGLHVRVPEVEPYHKRKASLFLTRDPEKAMEFYGLDVAKYWAGFADMDDLFDWACGGRFFSSEMFDGRVEKHNDRARQGKRPMYRKFVEEYMPSHADKGAGNAWTREQVLEEAIKVFGKRAEYDAIMEEHHVKTAEEELWKEIKAVVPAENNSLALALKGLRRWVTFDDGQPVITPEPNLEEPLTWSKFVSPDIKSTVLAWVQDNWKEVKSLERARANASKQAAKSVPEQVAQP